MLCANLQRPRPRARTTAAAGPAVLARGGSRAHADVRASGSASNCTVAYMQQPTAGRQSNGCAKRAARYWDAVGESQLAGWPAAQADCELTDCDALSIDGGGIAALLLLL